MSDLNPQHQSHDKHTKILSYKHADAYNQHRPVAVSHLIMQRRLNGEKNGQCNLRMFCIHRVLPHTTSQRLWIFIPVLQQSLALLVKTAAKQPFLFKWLERRNGWNAGWRYRRIRSRWIQAWRSGCRRVWENRKRAGQSWGRWGGRRERPPAYRRRESWGDVGGPGPCRELENPCSCRRSGTAQDPPNDLQTHT